MKCIRYKGSTSMKRVSNEDAKKLVENTNWQYSTKGKWKIYVRDILKFKQRSKKKPNPFGSKSLKKSLEVRMNRNKLPYTSPMLNDQLQRERRNRKRKSRLRIIAA